MEVNFHALFTIMLDVGLLHVRFTSREGPLLSIGFHYYSQSAHALQDKDPRPCQESNLGHHARGLVMLMTDLSQFLLREKTSLQKHEWA
jgi:hypothetical protein